MDYSYPLYCSCRRNGDRVALVGRDEGPVTYAELERRIAGLTAGLGELVAPGAAVLALTENEPETFELLMALARIGAVAVPVNTRLGAAERRFIAADAGVVAIVAADAWLAAAREIAAALDAVATVIAVGGDGGPEPTLARLREAAPGPPPGDLDGDEGAPATILYTSGTTGFPKGVVRSHRANAWNAVNSALGSPRSPADVELFNLPAFGIGFLHFAMAALLGGATVVLDRSFDPARCWELLERHRATRTFLAPTMIDSMLAVEGHRDRDLSALEVIYTAYAFPDRLRRAALDRFGEVFVYMYGLTEAQLTCATREEFATSPTSVGRSMGVSVVEVLDAAGAPAAPGEVGEIAFAGPAVMSGYHGRPEETGQALAAGRVRTGDLGRFDAAGNLHYVGRSKEMIKTGGFSVDPLEVENAILEQDGIAEVAVLGVEDEHWGEAVVAFVVPVAGTSVEEATVIAACKGAIASYKVPKRVHLAERLPKNPAGKVERGRLRDLAREQAVESDS